MSADIRSWDDSVLLEGYALDELLTLIQNAPSIEELDALWDFVVFEHRRRVEAFALSDLASSATKRSRSQSHRIVEPQISIDETPRQPNAPSTALLSAA